MDTIAIYLRLSSEDGDLVTASKEISNSIGNQRKLITDFITNNAELKMLKIEEYIDDGYSGTNFNRPSFQRMMDDAKKGNISVIITKDFSRLGRDYLEVGNYLEYIFPILGIRYISVNDSFDSHKSKGMTSGMSVALKNIINSMYSEDLSKKVTAAQKVKAMNGEVIQALVHYGYMKDPNDNHRLIIDKEAAGVVKKIFDYADDGIGFAEIARRLNSEGIPSVTQYFLNKGYKKNFSSSLDRPRFWTGSSVSMILKNESYKGTFIWGKTDQRLRTKRATNKRVIDKAESDWVVIENHHDAIISATQFDRVQEIITQRRPAPHKSPVKSKISPNLFTCPYCNRKLTFNTKTVCCSSGRVSLSEQCITVKASIEQLEIAVSTTVNQIAAYVLESTQKLMKKDKSCDIIEDGIVSLQKELKRIPSMKMQKYDLFKQGVLSAEQYQAVIEEIYANKEKLESRLNQLQEEQESMLEDSKKAEITHSIANEMFMKNGYNPMNASKFIKNIDVYSDSEIEIFFDVDDVFFNEMIKELE